MKFISLELNNFRQYKGKNYLEFAGYKENPNVTLIFGGNGFGKTGIFRAIMFCLYGDKYLEQDNLPASQKKEGLSLVNQRLLEESPEKKVTASVELNFDHNEKSYLLKRYISAMLKNDKIFQQPGRVSLQITENGNTGPPLEGDDLVNQVINEILSKSVRDFFLFDGERMERLTKYSDDSKIEVKKGIRILLQLDTLDIAQKGLKKTIETLDNKIKVNSSGELNFIGKKLENCIGRIKEIEEKLDILREEKQKVENLEKQIEQNSKKKKIPEKNRKKERR